MKQWLVVLGTMALALNLGGCGGSDEEVDNTTQQQSQGGPTQIYRADLPSSGSVDSDQPAVSATDELFTTPEIPTYKTESE